MTTPSQYMRRKMDSCTSVSAEMMILLKRRYADVDKEFDAGAVKESLIQLLQREGAESIYGSTVSRAGRNSQHNHSQQGKGAARLALKQAEINREMAISARRKEILVQQEQQKCWNAEIRNCEVKSTLSFSQLPKPLSSPPCTQVPQSTAPPHSEGKFIQTSQTVHAPHCDTQVVPKESELSLVQALKESLAMSRLPVPEPLTFTGDPLKFVEWSTCFRALIETSCTDSAHKLFYLKKNIGGEPLCVLEGTFYQTFRGKLSSWPKIGPKESLKLGELSDFLISCKNAMPHVQGLKVLDDSEENQKILLKLPDWATTRWNCYVTKLLDEEKAYPGFAEFADFVAEEAHIACNPVSSLFALKNTFEKPEKEQKRLKASVLVTSANVSKDVTATTMVQSNRKSKPNPSSTQNERQLECICCKQNHFIYKCEKFTAMPLEEKKQFIRDNNMCFACLRFGHISKNCRQRATCNVCRRSQPSPLHEDPPQGDEPETPSEEEHAATVSCTVRVGNNDCTSMIVPTLVYALLDTQSSNTFIDQDICGKIQASTEPVKLKLTTMTDRCSIVPSQRVDGLRVRGYNSEKYIDLPPTYTQEYITSEKNSIPTRETAKKWPHLLSIANEMPDLLDCPIALLIGYDCARALKPREVIPGNDYGPYAIKTDLGWSILGANKPWKGSMEATVICHRVTVKELPSVTPASVIKALENDLLDTNPKEGSVSQEDIEFLEMLNDNIHYNEEGHLEMPLPFRERPELPNNKQLAMVRLKRLKGIMDKNPKYKEDYIKFMNSVFEDGDAEEADGTSTVVFDCSAKHEGISLNDHLLTGPDLINALVGVLCRFREHQIAVMCDVEKMFHRFHVNPEDRDLRFLWWKDGNTDTEPKDISHASAHFWSSIITGIWMDDGLISIDSVKEAKQLVREAQEVCAKGKLRLHKFACNNKEIMNIIPETEQASNAKDVSLNYSVIQMQSVLGVKWNIEADMFSFSVALKERPATRQGILATVASVYDPLGFLSLYILTGKQVLQEMCKRGVRWDDPIPPALEIKWKAWLSASFFGYQQQWLWTMFIHHHIVADEKVHCALVMGKARVAATRLVTIPCLELTAAAVSAAVTNFLREELERKIDKEFFWTDSKVTLGYIKNDARRFHVFVVNRVQKMRDSTNPKQWFYTESDKNPADHASRGLKVADLLSSNWLTRPKFLWEREIVTNQHSPDLLVGDPEVKVLKTNALEEDSFLERIKRLARRDKSGPISVEERQMAAFVLFQAAQREPFKEELKWFSQNSAGLPKTHKMYQPDPILVDDLFRVGGQLRKSSASFALKHPVILPKEGIVTQLILDHCHKKTQHQGRGQTLNKLRESGYWIIGGSKVVAKYIKGCVDCRKVRGPTEGQRMADLPFDRVDPSPPFTYTGLDVFGPFYTKQGRKEYKRYGLLFTCLSSRAVHIEMFNQRHRQIRSDQGTNFVGARNEFKKGLLELDKEMISTYLAKNQCDFQMNVPEASHRGGVWERQIRTVRNVMSSVLAQATGRLDDTSLTTFFYDSMSILIHHPLTTDTIHDPNSAEPLTPNHLLTMKVSVPLPPPGRFVREDLYPRKRYQRVQYLTELFWSSLRQRWHTPKRNVQVGDVVILKEDSIPRNEWKLARVVETSEDDDGLVQKVKIQIGQKDLGKKGECLKQLSFLERPVQRLVVLVKESKLQ
ncbi:RAB6A-GEF complex partner protein 1 [Sarotherodon galilaeus]